MVKVVDYGSTNIGLFELLFENPVENLREEVEQIWSGTKSKWQEAFGIKYVLPLEPEEWSVYWRYWYVAESRLEVALNQYAVAPKLRDCLNRIFDPTIFNSAVMLWDSGINPTYISWWVGQVMDPPLASIRFIGEA